MTIETNQPWSPARSGVLPEPFQDVSLSAELCGELILLRYRGRRAALLAAGCVTEAILANQRWGARPAKDEQGFRFWKDQAPTRREPDRIMVGRWVSHEVAVTLPGVSRLFPEGLSAPKPPDAPHAAATAGAPTWKERMRGFCSVSLVAMLATLEGRASARPDDRFSLGAADRQRIAVKVRQFETELLAELDRATVLDKEAPRPALRLVVDNTRGDGA